MKKMSADKQQWTGQVMQSLDGLPPAIPRDGLYERVAERIKKGLQEKTRVIPLKTVSAAAAVLLLLLALNTVTLLGRQTAKNNNTSSMDAVSRYYNLNNDDVPIDL